MALRRAARGERPASSAGSSTFSTAVSSSIRWKAWNTNPTASRRSRARARSDIRPRLCPASQTSPAVGRSSPPSRCSSVDFPQPLGPITATVSPGATSRSTPSTARTSAAPCRIPCAARGRAAPVHTGSVHAQLLPPGPVPFAGLQPAQVRLQPEHDAFQQQPGRRAVRLGHRGALGIPQAAQQLAALRVDDGQGVGEPGRRGRDQLEMEFRQAGPRPAHVSDPPVTRCWPAAVSAYTLRSGRSAVRPSARRSPGPPSPAGTA